MKFTRRHPVGGRRRVAPVSLALFGLSAVLAGCSSDYETLSSQPFDTEYEIFSVLSRAGNLDLFLIKAFESDGKVALCGGVHEGDIELFRDGQPPLG